MLGQATRRQHPAILAGSAWLVVAMLLGPALAQSSGQQPGQASAPAQASADPQNDASSAAPIENPRQTRMPDAMKGVNITQNLGDTLPLDTRLTTSDGQTITLNKYFEGNNQKPVILNFAYYECPVLCSLVMEGLANSVRDLGWVPGEQFEIVTLTVDHAESTALADQKKQEMLKKLGMDGAAKGWHFHTATKGEIQRLASAAGFGYKYLPEQDQYVHKPAIIMVSPEGKITRYLKGIQFPSFKLKGSLMDASDGQVGSVVDKVVMSCFQYQELEGKYAASARGIMRLGGALTVFILVLTIGVALLREAIRRYHGVAADKGGDETDGS
jgi:protein SCO1/2